MKEPETKTNQPNTEMPENMEELLNLLNSKRSLMCVPEEQLKELCKAYNETHEEIPAPVSKDEPVKKKNPKKWIIAGSIIAAVLAIGIGLGVYFGTTTVVPDVTGMEESEAASALTAADLSPVNMGYVESSDVDPGLVVSVSNKGKRVKKNSEAEFYLSEGEHIEVASVVGKTYEDAETSLTEQGFSVTKKEAYNEADKGQVTAQSIEAGTIVTGLEIKNGNNAITLTISKGKKPITIANYKKKKASKIKTKLEEQGLVVKTKQAYNSSIKKGYIIKQSVAAGDKLYSGDTITFTVSKGVEMTTVPSVTGKTKAAAIKAIHKKKLTYVVQYSYSDSVDEGYVIRQSPKSGKKKAVNSEVTITVSEGSKPTTTSSGSSSSGNSGSSSSSNSGSSSSSNSGSSSSGGSSSSSKKSSSSENSVSISELPDAW